MLGRLKQRVVDRLGIERVAGTADAARADAAHALDAAAAFEHRVTTLEMRLAFVDDELYPHLVDRVHGLARFDTRLRVLETTEWAATAPLASRPLVSVVMATRDRASYLPEAIESVRAQAYDRWQLVVVDDGSDDDTSDVAAAFAATDDRIEVHRTVGVGAAAARNVGLDAARGEWVTFLDDDNTMHRSWLRAVAELGGREPGRLGFYGAQLRDDVQGGDRVPWMLFDESATIDRLLIDNTIDFGVLAVRRDHPELRFDETLTRYIDWDLVVRLFDHEPLLAHPVIASCYSTRVPQRITHTRNDDTMVEIRAHLAAHHAARHPER
jgi:hypothetical protein